MRYVKISSQTWQFSLAWKGYFETQWFVLVVTGPVCVHFRLGNGSVHTFFFWNSSFTRWHYCTSVFYCLVLVLKVQEWYCFTTQNFQVLVQGQGGEISKYYASILLVWALKPSLNFRSIIKGSFRGNTLMDDFTDSLKNNVYLEIMQLKEWSLCFQGLCGGAGGDDFGRMPEAGRDREGATIRHIRCMTLSP